MNMKTVWMVILLFMVAMVCGCVEEQKAQPVWGKGELPAEYTHFFGDGNGPRLDYAQSQAIDKHGAIITEIARRVLILEGMDPNELPNKNGPDEVPGDL